MCNLISNLHQFTYNINVNFYSACVDTVEAHFYGEVVTSGTLQFVLSTKCGRGTIQVDIKGGSYKRRLQLDVLLPKKEYELIAVITNYSYVSIKGGVKAKMVDVENFSIH